MSLFSLKKQLRLPPSTGHALSFIWKPRYPAHNFVPSGRDGRRSVERSTNCVSRSDGQMMHSCLAVPASNSAHTCSRSILSDSPYSRSHAYFYIRCIFVSLSLYFSVNPPATQSPFPSQEDFYSSFLFLNLRRVPAPLPHPTKPTTTTNHYHFLSHNAHQHELHPRSEQTREAH